MSLELDLPSVAAVVFAGLLASSPLLAGEKDAPAAEPVVPAPSSETPALQTKGTDPAPNPLAPIIEKMKSTGTRLDQGLLDDETRQAQRQIVADLEKLLRQSRQKSQNPQSPPSDPSSNPDRDPSDPQSDSKSDPSQNEGGAGPSGGQRRQDQKDAAESTERTQGGVPTEAERKNQRRVLTDSVWGHLPPRVREQLNRSISDRYLPEYEALVKRYYEALATRRRDAQTQAADADGDRGGSGSEARGGAPSP